MDQALDAVFLRSLVDFGSVEERVRKRLSVLSSGEDVLRFFVDYASWNGCFANGVSALTAMVGNSRDLFREPGFPRAVSDRSNYVASFFFDAARDEYDDHINPLRDSHRCMAQASLICMQDFFGLRTELLDQVEPPELAAVNSAVLAGYTGHARADLGGIAQSFFAMGFHLGSELLADREFSLIDEYLRAQRNALVQHLLRSTVKLAGAEHRCYAWVGVHSGHGGGVEADHFDHALEGARHALRYIAADSTSLAMDSLVAGFRAFDTNHDLFFKIGCI
jgi:uncharacterized membrane protein